MKKVAILLPSHWSAIQGGAEYQARLICRHLVASGRFEVHWLSRRVHPEYRAQGYTTHQIAEHAGLRAKAFFFDHLALSRLLREIRPDVIYQRVGSAYTGIAARHALQNNSRLIWHVASDMDVTPLNVKGWRPSALLRQIDKHYLEYGVRHASDIVVQTHDQNRLLGEHYGRQATTLIRNLHPLPSETIDKNGSPTVLWIANLKPNKQPEVFMRLARACLDMPQVRFVMIGEPLPDTAQQSAFENAVAAIPNLVYRGKLPIEEVNALLARSHLFVNTSRVEGFANTFIQAWMRQVPVLSLNVDPDGLLAQEGIGFCARGDEVALLRTLREWLVNASQREQIGQRAQAYAEAHHSERNIQALIDMIEKA
jgi:glycosyltransferase involved in cell wall biosynthesis